jgi:hypothetical protein
MLPNLAGVQQVHLSCMGPQYGVRSAGGLERLSSRRYCTKIFAQALFAQTVYIRLVQGWVWLVKGVKAPNQGIWHHPATRGTISHHFISASFTHHCLNQWPCQHPLGWCTCKFTLPGLPVRFLSGNGNEQEAAAHCNHSMCWKCVQVMGLHSLRILLLQQHSAQPACAQGGCKSPCNHRLGSTC